MTRLSLIAVLALFLALAHLTEGAVPPRPEQPHPDIFPSGSSANLQDFNPVNQKAKGQRWANYRLITMSGCVTGTVPGDLVVLEEELQRLGFDLSRNDASYDFTIRVNCGSSHIAICGSVNIFCLGRGFPFVADIDISDVISAWPRITRLSIQLHELLHALATWNEQYCTGSETSGICFGLPRFTPAPGWPDVMSTGELSRHLFESVELERWARTMYEIEAADPCAGETDPWGNKWDHCLQRWVRPNGWRYDPWTGNEELPNGTLEWLGCNADRLRWSIYKGVWMPEGHGFFAVERGFWSFAPPC